ncbi:hypothetical protein SPRG_10725 [Saprolegnia parasitica CBS 223.65]|uniref:PARP catalytic domain-containing protein n=1 Tax=Saprolegnia parasitica (strain CBS 223.65) TaxID=695850 RepID=A0A067CAF4_SAPPC|nr:hypothetical protein SPRG_10725 [Saprolegnia parasitica CBS 223.65]KDO23531.1 hypothetical protein SPRG_10725 [Saprolegnia parasitica CBS 223.65]|eukprot:XP_012205683.1 hypothetical protein SPRG_10725 [Saprolegnia parasitica CBS 223.65]
MSGTRHMSSGNVFGDGIYFAQSAQVAMNFAYGTPSQQWTPSGVLSRDAICVAVCLVLADRDRLTTLPGATPDAKYYVLTDPRGVRVEYLVFLEPKARSAMRVLLGSPWDVAISLFWFAVAYGLYRLCDATS